MSSLILAIFALSPVESGPSLGDRAPGLQWRAPAQCPDALWVLDQVDALLAPEQHADGIMPVRAHGEIRTQATGFELRADFSSAAGQAELLLQDEDCEVLAAAFALTLAMSAQPAVAEASVEASQAALNTEAPGLLPEPARGPTASGSSREDSDPTGTAGEPLPSTAPPRLAATDDLPPDRPLREPTTQRGRVEALAETQFEAGAGLLPRADLRLSGGFGISIALGHDALRWSLARARLEILASALWLAPRPILNQGVEQGEATGGGAKLRACYARRMASRAAGAPGGLVVPGCLFIEGGGIRARGGPALTNPRTTRLAWLGLGVGSGVRVGLGRGVSLGLSVEAQLQPTRPAFSLATEAQTPVHTAQRFALRGGLTFAIQPRVRASEKKRAARSISARADTP